MLKMQFEAVVREITQTKVLLYLKFQAIALEAIQEVAETMPKDKIFMYKHIKASRFQAQLENSPLRLQSELYAVLA